MRPFKRCLVSSSVRGTVALAWQRGCYVVAGLKWLMDMATNRKRFRKPFTLLSVGEGFNASNLVISQGDGCMTLTVHTLLPVSYCQLEPVGSGNGQTIRLIFNTVSAPSPGTFVPRMRYSHFFRSSGGMNKDTSTDRHMGREHITSARSRQQLLSGARVLFWIVFGSIFLWAMNTLLGSCARFILSDKNLTSSHPIRGKSSRSGLTPYTGHWHSDREESSLLPIETCS